MAQPMYQQIAEDLRRQIESGELARGSQLPTEFELRDRYTASRNTIRDALRRLQGQGLVETRPGQGTFVTRRIKPYITDLSPDPEGDMGAGREEPRTYPLRVRQEGVEGRPTPPKVEILTCPPDIATRLRVNPGSQVISRSQERYVEGILWSLQSSFYPLEWVTRGASQLLMAEDIMQGTIRYLAEALGLRQAGYLDTITARPADDTEQQLFGLPHDAAMFVIYRTAYTEDKTPTRVTVTICPADRNQFRYNYGTVPTTEQDSQWDDLDY